MCFVVVQAVHLTVCYDPEMRRKFGAFTMKKGVIFSMGFFFIQALLVFVATNPYKLCVN
jgi:hypothetical protein